MDVRHQAYLVAVPPQHYGIPVGKLKSFSGLPGTISGIGLRSGQLTFAFIALVTMIKVPGYHSITCFRYFVTAMAFHCIWSLLVGIVDVFVMITDWCLLFSSLINVFAFGDWVISIMTFSATCASAGITTLIDNDLNQCALNHCSRYEGAVAMAFLAWILLSISCYQSFWLMATR